MEEERIKIYGDFYDILHQNEDQVLVRSLLLSYVSEEIQQQITILFNTQLALKKARGNGQTD